MTVLYQCKNALYSFAVIGNKTAKQITPQLLSRTVLPSVLAMGPTVSGSGLTKDSGYLWVVKIHSMHFLGSGSKANGPMS
jgi:hypothetical protein